MKRLLPFAPLLLLAALLLSPAAALAGAKQGLDIWWGRVFPALLPSFICVRTAQELGLLHRTGSSPRGQLAAVIGFSLVSGAPNGAKLLYAITEDGTLSPTEGDRLLPYVNTVSPTFLLSIIASELLKNKALFLPRAMAFYGCILCVIAPFILQKTILFPTDRSLSAESGTFPEAFSSAIESCMLDMLRIGGCILFICTLLSVIQPIFPNKWASAILAGCMEVSIGASAIAELSLPFRIKTSLLTGAAAFGGLSLALQTLCCYPSLKLIPYLFRKLLLGVLTGLCCYLLFPLFPDLSAAFAARQEVLSRTLSISALLLSSILSAAFMAVLSLMIGQKQKN